MPPYQTDKAAFFIDVHKIVVSIKNPYNKQKLSLFKFNRTGKSLGRTIFHYEEHEKRRNNFWNLSH